MTISSTSRKAGPYIGSGAAATFPFAFKVFSTSDIEVVRLEVSTTIETVLVLTADYTAILNADQNSNPGGSITLVAGPLAAGFNLVLTSDVANLQGTDLTNQGGFYPEVINDSLDRATIQIQQLQEEVDRSAKLPITSAEDANALVADIVRLADSADNLDTDATNIGSINTVAAAITNVNTVATNVASVNTAAGSIANINATATNIANVNEVGDDIANVNIVAGNISNVNTVAGVSANVTTVATDIAAVNTVAADLNEPVSEIETVAGSITNVNTVGTNIASVNTVAGIQANVTTVAGISANVSTVATNSASVVTVATDIAAVTTVANDLNEPVSEIETVAGSIANVNTVGTNISSVNTTAANNTNITTVATNIADVQTVAGVAGNVNTVAGIAANVTTVAGISANVTTVAGISTSVSDVAAIDTDVTAVAAIDTDVTTVAGVASDIPTVADNVSNINDYANTYQGAKATAPTLRNNGGALLEGDMYFNTVSDTMFVYGSGGWVPAGSSVNGTSQRYKYTATAAQTTFTGIDDNGNTLTYDAGYLDVYLNGVHLDPSDYTASSGDTIVLGSGAALNDELYVVAFGTFGIGTLNGSNITDDTVNISKLNATGTRSGSTFLAGDNTFKTVAVTPTAVSDQTNSSNGYFALPVGTTAERPGSPFSGMVRINSTTGEPEWYDTTNTSWVKFADLSESRYTSELVIVAGGGGAFVNIYDDGSGSGGGGIIFKTDQKFTPGVSYTVTVGGGGSGANGSNSLIVSPTEDVRLIALGGGAGGHHRNSSSGGGCGSGTGGFYTSADERDAGSGTPGQGYSGGVSTTYRGAGGGGAGGTGLDQGTGGPGFRDPLTNIFYAGGGGGWPRDSGNKLIGWGGKGGGGNASTGTGSGDNGSTNTGGGGGGCKGSGNTTNGGSGVVIIRYLGAQRGTGGTVTSSGGYTIHTFTSSGTFTA
jgi:hypothetical protein